MFKKFVGKWNDQKLKPMYYRGIPQHYIDSTKRTKHKWNFASRMTQAEKIKLASMKDSVEISTNAGKASTGPTPSLGSGAMLNI